MILENNNREENNFLERQNKFKQREIPNPPIFNRTPARTIDPKIGASTWAFGNQRWNKYIGIFTRKTINIINSKKGISKIKKKI